MLTQAVIDDLVNELNANLDVPFIPEGQEERAIRWAVGLITPNLPEWFIEFAASAANGLTEEEMRVHEDVLVIEVNKLVDVPWTPESIEAALIRPVIHHLLGYAVLGKVMPGV
jgi:hypothetical protein